MLGSICYSLSMGDRHSERGEKYFIVILICISLIASDTEHFSMYLLITCISLKTVYSSSLLILYMELISILLRLLEFLNCRYGLDINLLLDK